MSEVAIGVGASHTTLMNTKWDEVDHLDRAHAFRDGLAEARRLVAASGADLAVIMGSNHFRGFWLDIMPPFTIGVGEVTSAGEHGTPKGIQSSDPAAALAICNALVANDIDLAFSLRLQIDHGISHAIQYVVPEGMPVVPLVINSFAPPLPSLRRALALGDALRSAIGGLAGDRRVAVISTGGLSHRIPFPDWRSPESDDDEFLVESWLEGRGHWEDYETRRRAIIVGAPPDLNEQFDHDFLNRLGRGEAAGFPDELDDQDLVNIAGNGSNEIRAWLAMAAATGHAPTQTLVYSPMPEWLTGMAVVTTKPDRSAS